MRFGTAASPAALLLGRAFVPSHISANSRLEDYNEQKVLKQALHGVILSATDSGTGEQVVLKKLDIASMDRNLVSSHEDARRESEVLLRLNSLGGHGRAGKQEL